MSNDLLDVLREQGCSVNDVKECLIDSSPNVADADGITPAHLAAMLDNKPIMRALLGAGASIMAQSSTGDTPLHVAAACGQDAIVKLLLQQADSQAVTAAALTTVNSAGQTPLHRAAACTAIYGHRAAACVRMLLKAGSDTSTKDSVGRTPQDLIERLEVHEAFNKHKRQRNQQQQQQSATDHTQGASGSHHSTGDADLGSAEGLARRTRARRAQDVGNRNAGPTTPLLPAAARQVQHVSAGRSPTTAALTAVAPTAHSQPPITLATPAAPAGSAAITPGAAAAAVGDDEETPRSLTSAFTKGYALLKKLKQQQVSFAELAAAEQQLRAAAAAINALSAAQQDFWLSTTGASIELYFDSMGEHGGSDVWRQNVLQMLQSCNTV